MTDLPGHEIGPFQLLREIGRGGMGVVYLARDARLDRDVAIKALPEELAGDAGRLERFEREARTLASLNHPNIGAIYGVEEQGGHKYLVLEYVEGETLADRLDRGPLPVDEAIEVAVEIARGLEAAHEAGVIHRDLKPANIKLTPEGKVKVLDFGLAKTDDGLSSTGSGLSQSPTMTSPMPQHSPTIPGAILGTAAYMSPEQARGRKVDKRTDIWAFGVVLYEMLTGTSPFAGETATDSLGAVLHKGVDLSSLPPSTPRVVRTVIQRCIERDRDERYHDIADVRLELQGGGGGAADVPAIGGRGHRLVLAAAVLGWLVAIGALAVFGLRRGEPAPVREPAVRTSVLAPDGYTIEGFEISPDGRQVSMVVSPAEVGTVPGPRRSLLVIRDLDSGDCEPVRGSDGVFGHRYSPDGKTIAFVSRGAEGSEEEHLMRLPSDRSAAPIEVLRVPPGLGLGSDSWFCWTPDGALAFLDRGAREVVLFDAGTGREIRRIAVHVASGETPDFDMLGEPFGDHGIAVHVVAYTQDGFGFDAGVVDLRSGELTVMVAGASHPRRAAPGYVLFSRGESVMLSPYDESSGTLTGSFRPVQRGLGTGSHWADGVFRLSDTGTLLYKPGGVQGRLRQLVIVERDGTASPWSEERRAFEEDVAISPDGSRLAALIAGPGGLFELWGSETGQPRLRRLHAESGGDVLESAFTPDGEYLVTACWNDGEAEPRRLMVLRFDGLEAPRRIWGGWGSDDWAVPTSVSADGERVLLVLWRDSVAQLMELPMDGSEEPRVLFEHPALYSADYPPLDLPLIGYVSTETGRAEVFVREVRPDGLGQAIPVTTRGALSSCWLVDEELGLCIAHFDLEWREFLTPIAFENGRILVGETRPTGRVGNTRYEDRSATRDGRYLAILRGEDEKPATHLELVQGWLDTVIQR